jgi:hypothetical protein
MEQYFDGDVDDLINDLKGDEVTDNIRVLIFNILADHQPISMSEMPSKYCSILSKASLSFPSISSFLAPSLASLL